MTEPKTLTMGTTVEDLDGYELVLVTLDEVLEALDERLRSLQGVGIVARLEKFDLRDLVDDLLVAPLQVQQQVSELRVVEGLQRLPHHVALHLIELFLRRLLILRQPKNLCR